MSGKKMIVWESWNAKVASQTEQVEKEEVVEEMDSYIDEISEKEMIIPFQQSRAIYTPLGAYPEESMLKPSDRWDCWIAHTNFKVTHGVKNILNEKIDGIEVLKITGKYSFFIGVARMFSISDVRKQIDEKICSYTEDEILSNDEIFETVATLRDQLEENNHWTILICPEGMIEYIVGNEINMEYLDGLNTLLEKKNNFGGVILRSDDG
tara:strand:- start:3973 stop:4599 length:627 start_codon:yes stop_codon:yes gene_type:complete